MTSPGPIKSPLTAYLDVQKPIDKDVKRLLARIAADAQSEMDRAYARISSGGRQVGATVTAGQRSQVIEAVQRVNEAGWNELQPVVFNGKITATNSANQWAVDRYNRLFSYLPLQSRSVLASGLRFSSEMALSRAIARLQGVERRQLSTRVYRNRDLLNGRIERIINSALGRGVSARNLAQEVARFIKPSTPGGVSYAAMRLARTEINNSFHAQQIRSSESLPFVEGQKWNLSESHPRPDECNIYAEEDGSDLGAGVFPRDGVPSKPHPHCLCYITPVVPEREAFVRNFLSGDYDSWLERAA